MIFHRGTGSSPATTKSASRLRRSHHTHELGRLSVLGLTKPLRDSSVGEDRVPKPPKPSFWRRCPCSADHWTCTIVVYAPGPATIPSISDTRQSARTVLTLQASGAIRTGRESRVFFYFIFNTARRAEPSIALVNLIQRHHPPCPTLDLAPAAI
ncbi:hypothetical protein LX36DRAFT_68132 [Colletotrichum falcatum]|nr:hypothetical protein LX36DRAFT_68132 [Colletotrichum falcatum]